MRRLPLLAVLVSLVVVSARAGDRPNLLLITLDDMNADSVGVYGCPVPETTPHIDALARRGLRFMRAHVQVGNCMPGRNVMWSGLYPHNNRVEGFYQVPDARHVHLVDLMNATCRSSSASPTGAARLRVSVAPAARGPRGTGEVPVLQYCGVRR